MSVLIVGAVDNDANSHCARATTDLATLASVEHVADLRAAAARLRDPAATVSLIVVAEPRPGYYSSDEIDSLRQIAPLARIWRILGSWCEGEQRSGQPPVACTATYWHRAPARIASEFEALQSGRCPTWGFPLTATPDEVLSTAAMPFERRAGRVVVCASRGENAAALAGACRLGGYETLIVTGGDAFDAPGAAAVVWDTSIDEAGDARRVERLRRAAGGAPVLAVVGFPRPHEMRRAIDAGVADVVSKPFLVRDLLWQVARAAG